MDLTLNFTLEELTHSETAIRKGISNEPSPEVIENLRRLARVLEEVRVLLGSHPILVSSGYRSPELNLAIGSSSISAHPKGLAADFTCPKYGPPRDCALAISRSNLDFDQVIWEGTWVHLGLAELDNRHQVLTATFEGGRARYSKGIA